MLFIPICDLAPFDSPQGQAQRSMLLNLGWFCCAWSQAYWPPDTHSARPTTEATTVQAIRAQIGLTAP